MSCERYLQTPDGEGEVGIFKQTSTFFPLLHFVNDMTVFNTHCHFFTTFSRRPLVNPALASRPFASPQPLVDVAPLEVSSEWTLVSISIPALFQIPA